jgi:SAM-dependent methyltransferase
MFHLTTLIKFRQMKINCPYCKKDKSKFLFRSYSFNHISFSFAQCQSCQCIHLHPVPGEEILEKAYSGQYYGEGESKFIKPVERFIGYFLFQRARLVHSLLRGKGRVLDIGCGNGKFLQNLSSLGEYEAHGVERPGNSAERAKRIAGLNIHLGEFDGIPLNGEFDTITMFHVFEHLTDPGATLDKIDILLKRGGNLVITVPNINGTQALLFKGFWFHLDVPRHIFFFKPKRFSELMLSRGYKLVRQDSFSLEHSIWGFYQSLMNCFFSDRDLFYEVLKGNQKLLKSKKFIFFLQVIFLGIVMPFAIIEYLISGLFGRGVQKEYVFQKI